MANEKRDRRAHATTVSAHWQTSPGGGPFSKTKCGHSSPHSGHRTSSRPSAPRRSYPHDGQYSPSSATMEIPTFRLGRERSDSSKSSLRDHLWFEQNAEFHAQSINRLVGARARSTNPPIQ